MENAFYLHLSVELGIKVGNEVTANKKSAALIKIKRCADKFNKYELFEHY
jgi:hypothetical protein